MGQKFFEIEDVLVFVKHANTNANDLFFFKKTFFQYDFWDEKNMEVWEFWFMFLRLKIKINIFFWMKSNYLFLSLTQLILEYLSCDQKKSRQF